MKWITLILVLVLHQQAFSQNLVPNPSFEDTLGCPYQWDGIQQGYAAHWFQPTWGSADLFTGCHLVPQSFNGYQFANTGHAYGGIITSCHKPFGCDPTNINREYLSVRLLDSLQAGVRYYCKISVSRADSVQYASNFGVLLSDSLYQASTMNLPYIPHFETPTPHLDKLGWTDYAFSFIASGGEEFITIGNFRDNANSDTTYTGDGGDPSNWEYRFSYYYIDDVCLSRDSLKLCDPSVTNIKEEQLEPSIAVYPNPTDNWLHVSLSKGSNVSKMILCNVHGQRIMTQDVAPNSKSAQLSLRGLVPAMYFLHMLSDSGQLVASRKIIKSNK